AVPFLPDLGTQARLLLSLPLLIAGELIVHDRIRSKVQQFLERGLIAPEDQPRFEAAIASAVRLRNSIILEVALILLSLTGGWWFWREYAVLHTDTWYAHGIDRDFTLTTAGYWYVLVSLPIFRFLLFRWYARILIWWFFLWRVSRIRLR